MDSLAICLGNEWERLGRRLNVMDQTLLHLKGNAQQYPDLLDKTSEMLKKWRNAEGDSATYQVLYEALCHEMVARKDLAQKICCIH